jgi:hypothetical protein
VLGSEDWSDSKVTRLFMRAYKEKDKSLARMIRDRDDYEDMTPSLSHLNLPQDSTLLEELLGVRFVLVLTIWLSSPIFFPKT